MSPTVSSPHRRLPSREDNTSALTDRELIIYVPEPEFSVVEEFLVYSAASFVADCGGMGGILLGVSLLALFDAAAANVKLARRARRRIFYSQSKKEEGKEAALVQQYY